MPVDGTIVVPPSTPRMERIKGRNERKLAKINRKYDLKENKVEARKIIDSIRIITKTVSDTVKTRSAENIKIQKIEAKQAIKETRIEQSWKKWLIGGSLLFLFLFILVYLILKRYKIL
jgi:di/tricarboxylate transporter